MADRVRALYHPGPQNAPRQNEGRGNTIFVRSRGQPFAPQTLVVLTMYADADQFQHRSERHPTPNTYPVGAVKDHDLKRGELAFSFRRQSYPTQATLPYDPRRIAFTSANGMQFGEDIMFMGTVDKEWLHDRPSGDNAVTIRIAGTNTVMNTGDELIQAGKPVVWDWPLCYRDHLGNLVNRLNIAGDGNTNAERRSKYLFATRPYHIRSVMQIFKELGMCMRQHYEEVTGKKATDDAPEPLTEEQKQRLITYAKQEHKFYSFERSPEPAAMPGMAVSAARVRAAQREANMRDPVRRFLGFVLASLGIMSEYWQPGTVSMRAVVHERAMAHHINDVRDIAHRIAKRQRQAGGRGVGTMDAASNVGIFTNQSEIYALKRLLYHPGLYADIIAGCAADAYDLMQSRVIGIALSPGMPGHPFDLYINKSVN